MTVYKGVRTLFAEMPVLPHVTDGYTARRDARAMFLFLGALVHVCCAAAVLALAVRIL